MTTPTAQSTSTVAPVHAARTLQSLTMEEEAELFRQTTLGEITPDIVADFATLDPELQQLVTAGGVHRQTMSMDDLHTALESLKILSKLVSPNAYITALQAAHAGYLPFLMRHTLDLSFKRALSLAHRPVDTTRTQTSSLDDTVTYELPPTWPRLAPPPPMIGRPAPHHVHEAYSNEHGHWVRLRAEAKRGLMKWHLVHGTFAEPRTPLLSENEDDQETQRMSHSSSRGRPQRTQRSRSRS